MMLHSSSGATAAGGGAAAAAAVNEWKSSHSPPGGSQAMKCRAPRALRARNASMRPQCGPEAKTAVQSASAHMPATAASGIETFNGTATAPARTIPKRTSTVSIRFSISTATRSCRAMGSAARPFATRAVASASSRQLSEAAPSVSAGWFASQRPFREIRSGSNGAGAWNHDMLASAQSAGHEFRNDTGSSRYTSSAAHNIRSGSGRR